MFYTQHKSLLIYTLKAEKYIQNQYKAPSRLKKVLWRQSQVLYIQHKEMLPTYESVMVPIKPPISLT